MMRRMAPRLEDVRLEIVTSTFVAAGRPDGVHDLGRLLENLNNPAISRQIELRTAAVRPLYRATAQLPLDAPVLVRRDEMIFANFEGPFFNRDVVRPRMTETPVLLMAPPFQLHGTAAIPHGADTTQALRTMAQGFFVLRHVRVFDAEGAVLGEGDQVIVNGANVQMISATKRHIAAITAVPVARPTTETTVTAPGQKSRAA